MKITVVELGTFIKGCERVNLSNDERNAIIDSVALNPLSGDLMVGTGGLRKLRVAGKARGKSGGYRVIHFFGGRDMPIFLITLYSKNKKDNLSKEDTNKMKALTVRLKEHYKKG